MSVKDALEKFSQKDASKWAKKTKPSKKNKKPEKEVEREVMQWLDSHGFSCHVVESKAVYSAAAGRYVRGQTVQGFPDIVGCDPNGIAVFIELKAKGRRSTIKEHQTEFLKKKLRMGAFALCCDSASYLASAYNNYMKVAKENRAYLLESILPKQGSKSDEGPLF